MTDLNLINVATAQVNGVNAKKETAKAVQNAAAQRPQMTEIPSASLGRDLVKPVSIIKAGDEILKTAFDAETKGGKATFTLAEGTEVFPNVWDPAGGNYAPKKGDIILGYGEVPKDWGISHPEVLKEMEEKGLSVYPDRAVSAEPELMYRTYNGAEGRDFVKSPLKPGETVNAEKKIFPTKFLFAEPGTMVETLEAREGAGKMPKLGAFQYIQIDEGGNPYVKDVKDLIKRLNPKSEESKEIFANVKDLIKQRDAINAENIVKEAKELSLSKVWKEALPKLMRKIH